MSPAPLVSVCVPTCNGAAYLAEALASVEAQDYESVEVIISDDASTDGTIAIAEAFAARTRFPCRILRHTPDTLAGNWNFAAAEARGEFVKYLFQDDLLYPSHLRRLVGAAEPEPATVLVFSMRDILFDEGTAETLIARRMRAACADLHRGFSRLRAVQPGRELLADPRLLAGGWNKIGEPSCTLIRRNALREVGGFDPSFRQLIDLDLYLRLMATGSVAFVDERLSAFRVHDRQLSVVQTQAGISAREEPLFARKLLASPLRAGFAPPTLRQLDWSAAGHAGRVPGPWRRLRLAIKGWFRADAG